MAQLSNTWGAITALACEYQVSRTFIYTLLAMFKAECSALFLPTPQVAAPAREVLEARMLAYRFEGRCSIDAIATLMKRDELLFASQGSVSESLTRLGQALPNTLSHEDESPRQVVFANDEVYAKAHPILITADPHSTAILKIELADNRTAEQWCQHYRELLANGFQPSQLTSDAGAGICAANAATFAEVPWQLDTFHAIAHRLGDWDRRLEKRLSAALRHAADREAKLASAKSDEVIDKRLTACFEADYQVAVARQLHEHFRYLYQEIIQQLNTFDTAGRLREHSDADSTMRAALDLMEELGNKALNQDIAPVRKALPDCLTYFETAQLAVKQCEALTSNQEALSAWYLAWQWEKTLIKSKQTDRKHHAIDQRDFYLDLARLEIGDKTQAARLKDKVYAELDQIIQASSIVECINSLLRPYLNNSKNQVTQEFLNLFMFYHNHRRYRAGKRKGKTPMEILTGKVQQEDWITLLQEQVRVSDAPLAS